MINRIRYYWDRLMLKLTGNKEKYGWDYDYMISGGGE